MTSNPLSGEVSLDTTDFKTGVAQLNRSLRILESGFRAQTASLGDWSRDMTGLEARMDTLNRKIDLQKGKVALLQREYERVAEEQGATSRAAENLQDRLLRETATLGKMERELGDTGQALEELGEATGTATRRSLDLGGALERLKGKLGSVGSGLKNLSAKILKGVAVGLAGIAAGAATALGGLVALTAKSIPAASDLRETVNKVGVVFGDAAAEIINFSKNSAAALGQSRQEALEAASQFGVFGKAAGLVGPDLADFSTTLTSLSSDLASFFNTDPSEAAAAIAAGLRGESEPLRKYGVLLDDATLRAKAFELGLISSTKEGLTPQQKSLAAYQVILDQTADAQGDFERTSDGLANSQRIIKAELADLSAAWGGLFLPIVERVSGFLARTVLPALSNVAKYIQAVVEGGDPLNDFLDAIPERFQPIVQAIGEVIEAFKEGGLQGGLTQLFGEDFVATLTQVRDWLQEFIPVAIQTLVDIWTNVLQPLYAAEWEFLTTKLIPILRSLAEWLGENLPPVIAALADFWTGTLQPAIQTVWNWLSTVLIPFFQNTIFPWLQEKIPTAIQTLSDFWTNTLLPAITDIWNFLSVDMLPIWEALAELLEVTVGKAIEALTGLWQNVLQPALEDLWEFIQDKVIPVFQDVWEWLSEKLQPAFEGVGSVIQDIADWIGELADAIANLHLPDWLTPGSPTPFEIGLRGINDALQQLNTTGLSELARRLENFGPVQVSGVAAAPAAAVAPVLHYSPVYQQTAPPEVLNLYQLRAIADALL